LAAINELSIEIRKKSKKSVIGKITGLIGVLGSVVALLLGVPELAENPAVAVFLEMLVSHIKDIFSNKATPKYK